MSALDKATQMVNMLKDVMRKDANHLLFDVSNTVSTENVTEEMAGFARILTGLMEKAIGKKNINNDKWFILESDTPTRSHIRIKFNMDIPEVCDYVHRFNDFLDEQNSLTI